MNTPRRGDWFMKPRIFISSTFYDLKYVREDISNFVKAHDFEPIMFEDGDIGYTPGKSLDTSCYETMRSADMVLLIIGGNYGSPASVETNDKKEFGEYTSITRQEFKTAQENGIPIFVFIEAPVSAEFNVYELNREIIKNSSEQFAFSATKNLNVFSFISEIKSIGNIAITEFNRPSEIKDFLGKQWSDMFKNYLKTLKEDNDQAKISDSLTDLRAAIQEMQLLVNGLFEKAFNKQNDIKYDSVKSEQRSIKAKNIARSIEKVIIFRVVSKDKYNSILQFVDCLINLYNLYKTEGTTKDRNDLVLDIWEKAEECGISLLSIRQNLFEDDYWSELSNNEKLKSSVAEFIAENQ